MSFGLHIVLPYTQFLHSSYHHRGYITHAHCYMVARYHILHTTHHVSHHCTFYTFYTRTALHYLPHTGLVYTTLHVSSFLHSTHTPVYAVTPSPHCTPAYTYTYYFVIGHTLSTTYSSHTPPTLPLVHHITHHTPVHTLHTWFYLDLSHTCIATAHWTWTTCHTCTTHTHISLHTGFTYTHIHGYTVGLPLHIHLCLHFPLPSHCPTPSLPFGLHMPFLDYPFPSLHYPWFFLPSLASWFSLVLPHALVGCLGCPIANTFPIYSPFRFWFHYLVGYLHI